MAKRCCGTPRGPSEESLARAFLTHAAGEAAVELAPLPDAELVGLFEDIWEVPALDLSLHVELPKLFLVHARGRAGSGRSPRRRCQHARRHRPRRVDLRCSYGLRGGLLTSRCTTSTR